MRDFLSELKKVCDEIKGDDYLSHKKRKYVELFNIHKRSLPPGIDKIVVFNVTKDEAEKLLEFYLKAKMCYMPNDPLDSNKKTLIYYDIVSVNALPFERSIYHNTKLVVIEEN